MAFVTAALIAFAPILVLTILTNVLRPATSYSLGTVGERLGQGDAYKARRGGLKEANLTVPR